MCVTSLVNSFCDVLGECSISTSLHFCHGGHPMRKTVVKKNKYIRGPLIAAPLKKDSAEKEYSQIQIKGP